MAKDIRSIYTEDGDSKFLTVYLKGSAPIAASSDSHPNIADIYEQVKTIKSEVENGFFTLDEVRDEIVSLFDLAKTVERKFTQVSERVSMLNGEVYFDGDKVDDTLTATIKRFAAEGQDFMPLVNFFEKIAANPQQHSREQFFRFVDNHGITITEQGDVILYKGVRKDDEGKFTSIHSGKAIVNGVSVTGYIPNAEGDVIDMPRSEVAHDPNVGCHYGLHAGTWSYAHSFAQGATLKVLINPRDVVSVPNDSSSQKVRVCRYKVLEVTEQPIASAFAAGDYTFDDVDLDNDFDEVYDDEDDEDFVY